jgi:hypothetical protein
MANGAPAEQADWAVLVYISADDILTNFAIDSLRQLKLASGGKIVVAAQVDKNGDRPARRYRFPLKQSEEKDSSLENNLVRIPLIEPNIEPATVPIEDLRNDPKILKRGIAEPINLTKFVNWASYDGDGKLIAERFCFIAWGHGVELLLDEDRLRTSEGKHPRINRRYLTPANLREGLEDTKLYTELKKSGKKFDIIGLDACSMSMVELASELQSCADFMVASQEDVPDVSFPYLKILEELKREAGERPMEGKEASRRIAELYHRAYSDYIPAPGSGVRAMTLSSLNLTQVKGVTDPLRSLADGLLVVTDPKTNMSDKLRKEIFKAILDARRDSRSFVFGLFVDLFNFCEQLNEKLGSMAPDLSAACSKICEEITERDGGFVIKNAKAGENGKGCHGLSIYLPYRDDDDTDAFQVLQALGPDDRPVKGGNRPAKGGNRPAKGGNRPAKERTARIEELEGDFDQLTAFKDTNWMQFIKQGWSRILTKEEPENLDLRYSGQQIAKNLAA